METWIKPLGGIAALAALIYAFSGIWSGLRRPVGHAYGRAPGLLRSTVFYILASLLFFGACILLWRPLPVTLSPAVQTLALVVGSGLYFPGLGLYVWGRMALGQMYFVSTTLGAELFSDHRLVTHGPYALVRHPMYLGCMLAALGGLCIYQTWTTVVLVPVSLMLTFRARREEQALSARFGLAWQEYARKVPAWLPRLRRRNEIT